MAVRVWNIEDGEPVTRRAIQDIVEDNGGLDEGWLVSARINLEAPIPHSGMLPMLVDTNAYPELCMAADEVLADLDMPCWHQELGWLVTCPRSHTWHPGAIEPEKVSTIPREEFVSRLSPAYVANMRWVLDHQDELAGYADQWVVVGNERIFCVTDSREEAMKRALEAGMEARDIVVEYIESFDRTYGIFVKGIRTCDAESRYD